MERRYFGTRALEDSAVERDESLPGLRMHKLLVVDSPPHKLLGPEPPRIVGPERARFKIFAGFQQSPFGLQMPSGRSRAS